MCASPYQFRANWHLQKLDLAVWRHPLKALAEVDNCDAEVQERVVRKAGKGALVVREGIRIRPRQQVAMAAQDRSVCSKGGSVFLPPEPMLLPQQKL